MRWLYDVMVQKFLDLSADLLLLFGSQSPGGLTDGSGARNQRDLVTDGAS